MPAVTTKFTDRDALDLQMFETNIKAQIDAGVLISELMQLWCYQAGKDIMGGGQL